MTLKALIAKSDAAQQLKPGNYVVDDLNNNNNQNQEQQ